MRRARRISGASSHAFPCFSWRPNIHKRHHPVPSGGPLEILLTECVFLLYRSCLVISTVLDLTWASDFRFLCDKRARQTPRQPTTTCPISATNNGRPPTYHHSTTRLKYPVPMAAERKPTSLSYPSSSLSYAQSLTCRRPVSICRFASRHLFTYYRYQESRDADVQYFSNPGRRSVERTPTICSSNAKGLTGVVQSLYLCGIDAS